MEGTFYEFLYETRHWLDVIGLTLIFARQSGSRTTVRWEAIDCYSFVVDACGSPVFARLRTIGPKSNLSWIGTGPFPRIDGYAPHTALAVFSTRDRIDLLR